MFFLRSHGQLSFCSSIVLLILLSAFGNVARAQWQVAAPRLLQNFYTMGSSADYGGVILYKDGVIIAAKRDAWISRDEGSTWSPLLPLSSQRVISVDIFDQNNFLVSFENTTIQRTTNGGLTWLQLPVTINTPFGVDAIYLDAPDHIAIASSDQGLRISMNGGSSWVTSFLSNQWFSKLVFANGVIHSTMTEEFRQGTSSGAQLISSTNFGATWRVGAAVSDWDCYTMSDDKCDPSLFYLVNEDAVVSEDNASNIFRTSDEGASWRSVASGPTDVRNFRPYFTGGISSVADALFVQTRTSGILRSTDQGGSWDNIGGPNVGYDCRFVTAASANTIFAVDSEGSVWITTNSGGMPIAAGGVTLSTHELFALDSLYACDKPVTRQVDIASSGCTASSIANMRVEGDAAASYTAALSGTDAIAVTFTPNTNGTSNANLIILFSNGMSDTVKLAGFVWPRDPLLLTASPDQTTNVIGESMEVPIVVHTLRAPTDITIVLNYDTRLSYRGSFDPSGIQLDMPGESWAGRSKLLVRNAGGTNALGSARFTMWAGADQPLEVSFDSLTVVDPSIACTYIAGGKIVQSLQGSRNCGDEFLGAFIRNGQFEVEVTPNPVKQQLIVRTSIAQDAASISIVNATGSIVMSRTFCGTESRIDVRALTAGTYACVVRGPSGVRVRTFIVQH
jgi:photosystem II stability/assembly factor-like uncharacterized protein